MSAYREKLPERSRAIVVAAARGWLGTPYTHQASLKGIGCDCLGLLRGVWRETIGAEPERPGPYSSHWAEFAEGDPFLAAAARHLVARQAGEILPGSVLFFRWQARAVVKHCGIATGEATFIHAHEGAAVAEVPLIPAWRRRLAGIFDFPDLVD